MQRRGLLLTRPSGLHVNDPTAMVTTAVEVPCSEDVPEKFHLFRAFDFGRSPKLYVLRGSLRDSCSLEPTLYRATR